MTESANIAILAGEAGAIRLGRLPAPRLPKPSEILVRMALAPVNAADILAIDGSYTFAIDANAPLGAEGVGVVEQLGSGVSDLHRGDLVLPLDRGNWARYRTLDRSRVIAVPPGIEPLQAAAMRINPATAWLLLEASGVARGGCLIQNACASTVAHWVRALATRRGITVIDIARPGSKAAETGAIPDDEQLEAAVRAARSDRPLGAALDCVAGDAIGRLAACVDSLGTIVSFGHLSGEPVRIRSQLLTGRELTVRGFSLRPAEARMTPAAHNAMFTELWAMAQSGSVGPPARAVVPLAEADRAIALARSPGRGRVLIDLDAISGM
jgi:NADPH:quinone reductase-like Zn-dependent oxidoreductase